MHVHAVCKHFIKESVGQECLATAKNQIRVGSEITARNKHSTSSLHAVARSGHLDILRILLDEGADVNAVDKNGCSVLDVAENICCKDELKRVGADGWTALMMAAEHSSGRVEEYFQYREAFLCQQNRLHFPAWFVASVNRSRKTKILDWTWGAFEESSIHKTSDALTVEKVNSSPDYSCAVGSCVFEHGVHIWAIQVESVQSMWLGIARGVEEKGGLGSNPGSDGDSDYMLVFSSSSGEPTIVGEVAPVIERRSNVTFSSCQIIEFELDMNQHCLTMKIDAEIAVVARNVDDKDIRPYICMDYNESATILSRSVIYDAADELDSQETGCEFDNSLWGSELDAVIEQTCVKGKVHIYVRCPELDKALLFEIWMMY